MISPEFGLLILVVGFLVGMIAGYFFARDNSDKCPWLARFDSIAETLPIGETVRIVKGKSINLRAVVSSLEYGDDGKYVTWLEIEDTCRRRPSVCKIRT